MDTETHLRKTRAKIEHLRAQERQLKTRLSREARRKDTRRKILIGSWLLSEAGGEAAALGRRMDGWLSRPADRVLFGLPPTAAHETDD